MTRPAVADVVDLAEHRAARGGPEPWVTKRQLAEHLGMSERWVELRVRDGMPSEVWGRARRFKISAVEDWLTRRAS